jgi:hypothetical protein
MDDWRRALLAFYSLLFAGLAALLIVLAWDGDSQLDLDLSGFRLVSFIETSGADRLLFTGLMFFIAWFALITLAMAVFREKPRYRDELVVSGPEGTVTLTRDAVSAVLREEIEMLPVVREAFPAVRFTKDAVETDITLVLEPGANLSHAVNAVTLTAGRTISERFGARLLPPGISVASGRGEAGSTAFTPPPPPMAVRRIVRPNDGQLEFPVDDGA